MKPSEVAIHLGVHVLRHGTGSAWITSVSRLVDIKEENGVFRIYINPPAVNHIYNNNVEIVKSDIIPCLWMTPLDAVQEGKMQLFRHNIGKSIIYSTTETGELVQIPTIVSNNNGIVNYILKYSRLLFALFLFLLGTIVFVMI